MACAHKAQRHGKPCPTRRVQEDGDGDRGGAPELTGTQPRHGMTLILLLEFVYPRLGTLFILLGLLASYNCVGDSRFYSLFWEEIISCLFLTLGP